jgi:hypothetical protein
MLLRGQHEPAEFRDHLELRHRVSGKVEDIAAMKLDALGLPASGDLLSPVDLGTAHGGDERNGDGDSHQFLSVRAGSVT